MTGPYDDIIHLPHHTSTTRSPMPLQDRAAQFAPFAALTGYDTVISETARLTDYQIELEEDDQIDLDRRLAFLLQHRDAHPLISVTHFVPDSHKAGGTYITTKGHLKKVDEYSRQLVLSGGISIPLEHIAAIESDQLPDILW